MAEEPDYGLMERLAARRAPARRVTFSVPKNTARVFGAWRECVEGLIGGNIVFGEPLALAIEGFNKDMTPREYAATIKGGIHGR